MYEFLLYSILEAIMEFAAHINGEKVQTVQEHCLNTAKLCAKYCTAFNAANIGYIQGILHDAGKLSVEFNNYIRGLSESRRGDIDHSFAGAKYIMEITDKKNLNLSMLIARTIISHHGLHDWVDNKCRDYFRERTAKTQEYENIKSNIVLIAEENELSVLLDKALSEYKIIRENIRKISKSEVDCSFYLGMLERILQSALIDADRTDTAAFMNAELFDENMEVRSLWMDMRKRMEIRLQSFSNRNDNISLQRKSISDRCAAFGENDVRVCRMIVPTGGGKTLSSLRFAIEYCINHDMERIVYTAPFMSILEQNSDEIRSIAGDEFFIEHHSNAMDNLDPDDESDEYREYELHTERWDSPVIATTMVQFLNTLFLDKTSAVRRMHRLSKSVIIIDEVQSIPVKCVNLFNLAVNFLTNICGAAVVLCSATQPVTEETPYPMIIDENNSMTGDYTKDFDVFRRTNIISCIDPYGYTYEGAAEFCYEKFNESGNLLAIVNTKSAALKLFEILKEKCGDNFDIIHLSTNMCPQHRREKIQYMRKLLDDNKPVICVTTQLIEAGVDISFKCVVRSSAGLDNAVQSAGRCNRHGEVGKICPIYIIKIKEENLGNLKEIASRQRIIQHMLDSNKYSDLQSADTVYDYFRMLYTMEKSELSYIVHDDGQQTNLLELLSLNRHRWLTSSQTSSKFYSQAFKTAGRLFQVMEKNTLDVIVPYNKEAVEIINELENCDKKIGNLLRKAQKYTVSVYQNNQYKLNENYALRVFRCGVVVLDHDYYDSTYGIQFEGAERELLMF